MNKSDSERIASALEKKGYLPASKINEADLIVVNMCSVRQSAVDRIYGFYHKFKNLKKRKPKLKTVLTGCILKSDKRKFREIFDEILGNKNYFSLQPKYQNKVAYIPISNGCNNFCTYCVVPFTRGSLVCRNHQDILREVKEAVKNGFKEIWLLGQNVNDYQDKSKIQKAKCKITNQNSKIINFSKLIKMVNKIPGDFKFFFTSPHPKNFSDELIETLAECEKFGRYLNLPVQSGDNKILKKMNRNYTVKEYKNLVKKIRKKIPEINLSTDVIVGFPGETKKQFENTVKLFKEIKFDLAYIAKYSPRPGTAAFKMKDNIPLVEKKRREKILREIINTRC
jgi:tRNA-2-methylthio-N6-dimethylallyladenosine synthase